MNIYISNVNFSTTSESLQELFSGFGEVSSANVIKDRETGRSRGFAFVEMPNDSEANTAIAELNETEFEGKVLNVSVARPKTERRDNNRFGGGGYRGGNRY
ncbi:MAG: RNA-binding protein [Paludibacteraceae bacterium]